MRRIAHVAWAVMAVLVVVATQHGSAARAEEPVKIGVILPYSGVYASLGGEITQGMELGFETYGPEVAGRAFELITAPRKSECWFSRRTPNPRWPTEPLPAVPTPS